MLYKFSNLVHCSLTTVLILTAVIGDLLVAHSTVQLHKAFFDNLTHAAIAGISWLIVCFQLKYDSILKAASEAFVCSLLGSFIDLDHFLMAHSMHLKVSLKIYYIFLYTYLIFFFFVGSYGYKNSTSPALFNNTTDILCFYFVIKPYFANGITAEDGPVSFYSIF